MSQILKKRQRMSVDTDQSGIEKFKLLKEEVFEHNVCEERKNVMRAFTKNMFGLLNEKSLKLLKEYFEKGL